MVMTKPNGRVEAGHRLVPLHSHIRTWEGLSLLLLLLLLLCYMQGRLVRSKSSLLHARRIRIHIEVEVIHSRDEIPTGRREHWRLRGRRKPVAAGIFAVDIVDAGISLLLLLLLL